MTADNSMGAYLRAARRQRRVSIERAAEETRIRPDFLMRMESDEFDFLAPAYVRGFLRTYTRFLGLKSQPFLDEFDRRFGSGRADTSSLVALERRGRRAPRQRRQMSSWAMAATIAGVALILLAAVGFLTGGDEEGPRRRVALTDDSPTPTPSPTPTLTPTPTDSAVALTEGLEVELVASVADCWVDVTADGANIFSDTIELGGAQTFTAEEEIVLVLGNAGGVEVTVNGQALGFPGSEGEVVTIKLPDDIDSFI